jgi:hypothetical protein
MLQTLPGPRSRPAPSIARLWRSRPPKWGEDEIENANVSCRSGATGTVASLPVVFGAPINYAPVEGGGMFYGSKEKKPIDMDDLSRREIPQYINGAWRGWHAFRRGLR